MGGRPGEIHKGDPKRKEEGKKGDLATLVQAN